MCSSIIICQTIFLEDTQNGFFRSLVFLEFTHSSLFQCIWNVQAFQFWLSVCRSLFISSSFSCVFCSVSVYLGVEDSHLIFSYTNHLQYHVIMIVVFLWNRWFRKFNWDYLKHIFHRKNTYYSILENCVLKLESNN